MEIIIRNEKYKNYISVLEKDLVKFNILWEQENV